jgi:hypothetical protein
MLPDGRLSSPFDNKMAATAKHRDRQIASPKPAHALTAQIAQSN